jgi:hypothetical protein
MEIKKIVVYKYTAQCMETNMCVKHTNVFMLVYILYFVSMYRRMLKKVSGYG